MKIDLIKSIDKYFGSIVVLVLSLLTNKPTNKVAFIQFWGLGETVLTLPAIKWYKEKNPDKQVFVFCNKRVYPIFENQPFIDCIVFVPLSPLHTLYVFFRWFRAFDVVYDLEEYLNISAIMSFFIGRQRVGFNHGLRAGAYNVGVEYRDNRYVTEEFNTLIGAPQDLRLVNLKYSAESKSRVDDWLKESNFEASKIVVLVDDVAESGRQRLWAPENWLELYRRLNGAGLQPVFKMSPGRVWPSQLKEYAVFDLNIYCFYYLAEICNCVITLDTGPMHIAAAQGAKTICLFGPNLPLRWAPRQNVRVIHHKLDCCPCIDSKSGMIKACDRKVGGYSECMSMIGVDEVYNAALA